MPALVSRKRRVRATRGRGGAKEATTSKDVMKSAGEDNNPGGETVKWWRREVLIVERSDIRQQLRAVAFP